MLSESDDEKIELLNSSQKQSYGGASSKCAKCNQLEFEILELKAELMEIRKKEGTIAEVT